MRSLGRKLWKYWARLGLVLLCGLLAWCLFAFQASKTGRQALQSGRGIVVTHDAASHAFAANSNSVLHSEAVGFLFFPGSLVEPAAYAPMARSVAQKGFLTILVELPRRGAFGGAKGPRVTERARNEMKKFPGIHRWVIGGHSLGGAVAARFVKENNAPDIAGLILMGTSHPKDFSLRDLTIPVTKIIGTRDGLAGVAKSERTRANLPATARWIIIEGGNHSQFGWYGFQPGDKFASIGRQRQQELLREAIMSMLKKVGKTE